ncbi:MAG: hypothetical protein HY075_01960 [Deltaproteobacteria bacterium]|nr:hypothetical protein [Deltaproteobacteria bacterium]
MAGFLFGLLVAGSLATSAFAVPGHEEAYRSDRLGVVIYKDGGDPNVFWYLPPLKLYEADGKIVSYRRPKGTKVDYYFYIVPYMTNDLVDLLAGEVPNLQNKSQLRPVIAQQFGIQVKQFDTAAMGEKITDFHYVNQPQLIKFSLEAGSAEDFDFFIQNKPGIQANVLFTFQAEHEDKYLKIELSYKEVYDAMNIGATGKYSFAKAEIAYKIENYISKKYFNVKSKGDIPIPDIVNKVIEECFTPYQKQKEQQNKKKPSWEDWLVSPDAPAEAHAEWEKQADALALVEDHASIGPSGWDPGSDDWGKPAGPSGSSGASGSSGSSGSSGGWGSGTGSKPGSGLGGAGDVSIEFTFKKELANSEKAFYYSQQHYVDASETASLPVYLSLMPSAKTSSTKVTPLTKHTLVVESTNANVNKALTTGINVQPDEQYIINAAFTFSARSAYDQSLKWYRWQSAWPSIDEDLYYRVGNSPWNKVGGRAIVKTDSIYHGELQFYLDREHIWSKIPADYKDSKMLGFVPAIFTFKNTFPQYNVVVTGRKVEYAPQ